MSVSTRIEYIVEPSTVEDVRQEIAEWADQRLVTLQLWSAKQQDWVNQQHGEGPNFQLRASDIKARYADILIADCWVIPNNCLVYIEDDVMTLLTVDDRLVRFVRQ